MTWSMGTIFDRSQEHLGSTDTLIIRVRRRLLAAARALEERGTTPPGVDHPRSTESGRAARSYPTTRTG